MSDRSNHIDRPRTCKNVSELVAGDQRKDHRMCEEIALYTTPKPLLPKPSPDEICGPFPPALFPVDRAKRCC